MTSSASALSSRFQPLESSEEKDPAGPISPSATAAAADCFLMLKGAFALILPSSSSFCKTRYFTAFTEIGEKNKKPLDIPCWRLQPGEERAKLEKWTPSEHKITGIRCPDGFPSYLLQQILCEGDAFPCVRSSNVFEIAPISASLMWPELMGKCDRILAELLLKNERDKQIVRKVDNLLMRVKNCFPKTERICPDAVRENNASHSNELAEAATSLSGVQKKIESLKKQGIEVEHLDLSVCYTAHSGGGSFDHVSQRYEKEYSFTLPWIEDEHFVNLMKAMPGIRSLSLKGCTKLSQRSAHALVGLQRLEILRLDRDCEDVIPHLARALVSMKALRVLDLAGVRLDLHALEPIWKEIAQLEELDITKARFISERHDAELEFGPYLAELTNLRTLKVGGEMDASILRALPQLKKLESLIINGKKLTEADVEHMKGLNLRHFSLLGYMVEVTEGFLSVFKNWKELESLSLGGTIKGDLGPCIPHWPNLTSLELEGGYGHMNDALSHSLAFSKIEDLKLGGDERSPGTVVNNLKKIKTLRSLAIHGGNLDLVGPPLAEMKQLESLTLSACSFRHTLAPYVAQLSSLRNLEVAYGYCSGMENLSDAICSRLHQMPSLERVKFDYYVISSSAKKALKECNPDLIIEGEESGTCTIL